MHGLVLVDEARQPIRNSIIWCDSRAVETGEKAFHAIGEEKCLVHLLNSPGNFTRSRLSRTKNQKDKRWQIFKNLEVAKEMAPQIGFESTVKRNFNSLAGPG